MNLSEKTLSMELSEQEAKRILRERAIKLARRPESESRVGETIEILVFELSTETYGIEIEYIKEVFQLKSITTLPLTPGFIVGIMNVRGEILSIIDLKKFLELPGTPLSDLNKVVVLKKGLTSFGILADKIVGVRGVPLDGLVTSLPTLTGFREEYLKGITNERMYILDANKVLCDDKLKISENSLNI